MLSFNIGRTIDFRDNQCPFSREFIRREVKTMEVISIS